MHNALEPENQEETTSRRRSSTSKLTRDLLPAQRGVSRPGSHSVFNNLILDDDPLDGSRSLRKRKASSERSEATAVIKRRRGNTETSKAASRVSASPVPANDDNKAALVPDILPPGLDENVEAGSASTRRSRSSRASRRQISKINDTKTVFIVNCAPGTIVVAFKLNPAKLVNILQLQPKKKRRRPPRRPPVEVQEDHSRPTPSFAAHYATPFYSFHERENDDLKSKPYGGILSETEADTSKTLPLQADRARFNDARQKAEDEWKLKTVTLEAEIETKGRSSQKLAGPPSKIKCVNFGGYEIETWYAAPYPEEYSRNRVLYICEFCLKYMSSDYVAWRHKLKCPAKHPPGDEIYRSGSISVFEVDGRKNPVYCQNLCLLAKLFLGSKTLYYDVEPFLFYVMTEYDELGCHFVGYFSKEKRPSSQNNVSCILTLPTHQRKGYGNLLISFSYLLTRVEAKTGSPEKPLSDMGLVSYRNYWRLVLSYELLNQRQPLSIVDLSNRTGMTADDIVAALEGLRALVRDPVTKKYALRLDYAYYRQYVENWESKGYVTLDEKALIWTPYMMGHNNLANYDRAPPLSTVAPREGEDEDKAVQPEEGVQQSMAAISAAGTDIVPTNGSTSLFNPDISPITINGLPNPSSSRPIAEVTPMQFQNIDPALVPPLQLPASQPLTPKLITPNLFNGVSTPRPPSPIPATRYEVFPPIPGTTSRRRGGWRGGPRRSAATNGHNTPTSASGTPLKRGGKALSKGLGIGKGKGKVVVGKSPRHTNGNTSNGGKSAGRRTRLSGLLDMESEPPVLDGPSGREASTGISEMGMGGKTLDTDNIGPSATLADANPDEDRLLGELDGQIQGQISMGMMMEVEDAAVDGEEDDNEEEEVDEEEEEEEEEEEDHLPDVGSSAASVEDDDEDDDEGEEDDDEDDDDGDPEVSSGSEVSVVESSDSSDDEGVA